MRVRRRVVLQAAGAAGGAEVEASGVAAAGEASETARSTGRTKRESQAGTAEDLGRIGEESCRCIAIPLLI